MNTEQTNKESIPLTRSEFTAQYSTPQTQLGSLETVGNAATSPGATECPPPSAATNREIIIAELLPWSEATEVRTTDGRRMLRKSLPDQNFWELWRDPKIKTSLKSAGVSVRKQQGAGFENTWEVCLWLPIPKEQLARETAAIDASKALHATIEVAAPEGLAYLPFQKAGIAWLATHPQTLLGDDMGTGKTIQFCGLLNYDPTIEKVLVICPASLRLNWKHELEKWLVVPRKIVVQYSDKPWAGNQADIVITNYEVAKKFEQQLTAIEWDLFAADECHALKNPEAQRTQIILGCKAYKERLARSGIKARRRVFMSGTLVVNRPIELFSLLQAVDPQRWSNWLTYAKRYCAATETRFGWDCDGASNLDELQGILRSNYLLRRVKADVLAELPPKRRQIIELPTNGAARAVAAESSVHDKHQAIVAAIQVRAQVANLADDQDTYKEEAAKLRVAKAAAFAELSVARHNTALAKLPACLSHITDLLEEVPKLVVMAHHRDIVESIHDAFKSTHGAVMLYGGMTDEAKDGAVQAFQNDPNCRVFVGSVTAAGVGLTLTAASHMVFAELDWRPGIVSQSEDRIHRIGTVNPVLIQHLVLDGSLDARMVRVIVAKQAVIDNLLDKTPQLEIEADPVMTITTGSIVEHPAAPEVRQIPVTEDLRNHVHAGLKELAGVCDRATSCDSAGFNKFDAALGHALAHREKLSDKMVRAAIKLCTKYRRQLGPVFSENLLALTGQQEEATTHKATENEMLGSPMPALQDGAGAKILAPESSREPTAGGIKTLLVTDLGPGPDANARDWPTEPTHEIVDYVERA